ncbi:MAG TPA: glycosylase [Elusimicrobia bacterium]|nr:MAG: glycosylase [Elusimicrobia bacterium GWA2_51_34]HAF96496.1 glycosylase [Elusimicrobiota bacterium]HCE97575.1 glycosylase [Elusimicrobiota bacterium]
MFRWRKYGLIFNPTDFKDRPEWINEYAQAPNAIVFEKFVRVFFCCRPKPDAKGQFVSYCAFVDLNRHDLSKIINIATKPVLELGALGTFDEFGTYPVSVIKESDEIIAYYGGWTRCESVPFNISLGCAKSKDNGESFAKTGVGPVLSHSLDEPFVVTSPKIRKYNNSWYLFYTSGQKWFIYNGRAEIVYKLRLATSSDRLTWKKVNKNIITDKLGPDEAQACPDVIYANGKYHMFYCYRQAVDFRVNTNNTYRIGYAFSNDLINWTRDDSKAGIDISESGFDNEMVAYPTVIELDRKYYMFYLGNKVGKAGFGLAELEGDLK